MTVKPDFSKEDWKGTAVEFAPGAWVCGDVHNAGGITNLKVNNRAFVYKLKLEEDLGGVKKGDDALFIHGLGNENVIKGVKELEKQTGLKAVAMLCNGSSHHMSLKFWYEAFPEPFAIWVCPTKPPQTSNGEMLMKTYPDRWELADNSTVNHHVHQLIKYFGDQVDCVLFNQLYGNSDKTGKALGAQCLPGDKPKTVGSAYVFKELKQLGEEKSQPIDDTVFFHKATKMIVTGHLWEFSYRPKGYTPPDLLKDESGAYAFILVRKLIYSPLRYDTGIALVARLRDPAVHAEQWKEVMKWNFEYACGHHDVATICGPIADEEVMNGKGGIKGHITRKLIASGELNNEPVAGSWCPWKSANALQKVIAAEPKFLDSYGEPPVLPMGGPGYDARGMKK